jgi:superfamily I DNA/RNA helicase
LTREEVKEKQDAERRECLQKVLDSTAPKKLIVAGAGTGKTYTFREILKLSTGGKNLVMTFIRKLVADMEAAFGTIAEVKTLHKFCKKVLHERNGRVELVPYLTKIIESDAGLLGITLANFDEKIRTLEEGSAEVKFYLERGDYYEVVGFDDSVYRLYRELKANPSSVPSFDQILIDEFQDFNPLEVAFLDELATKGNLLIVGDDDQAVYDGRSASPSFLRDLYRADSFEVFQLPFCSRCPEVIVDAINAFIERAQTNGHFKDRIPKRYECFLNDKEADSLKYPKIVVVQCTTARIVARYIQNEITKIDPAEIEESHRESYPTVLIVGARQYLREIEKELSKTCKQIAYSPSSENDYSVIDGYSLLLTNRRSNLAWRILAELFLDVNLVKDAMVKSTGGTAFVDLLDKHFVERHIHGLDLLIAIREGHELTKSQHSQLSEILSPYATEVLAAFAPPPITEKVETDTALPTVLLTSLKGSKGLSAGHVFIVGANNGSLPRDQRDIEDVEISQFIVAMSRTRKQCHIVSNRWLIAPFDKKGKSLQANSRSKFLSWIPVELIENRGTIKAGDLKT